MDNSKLKFEYQLWLDKTDNYQKYIKQRNKAFKKYLLSIIICAFVIGVVVYAANYLDDNSAIDFLANEKIIRLRRTRFQGPFVSVLMFVYLAASFVLVYSLVRVALYRIFDRNLIGYKNYLSKTKKLKSAQSTRLAYGNKLLPIILTLTLVPIAGVIGLMYLLSRLGL